MMERRKLKNAFMIAGLVYQTKWGTKTVRNFPHIVAVKKYPAKTVYVFKLPHGVDPSEVKKKDYVFKSMFGEQIEFSGEFTVTMTVHAKSSNESYPYRLEDWDMTKHRLPIIAGKDRNGILHSYDMTTNPHLLIAGETGSGKSVMLRAIITSLVQAKRTGLKLYLADMKRSEFHLFRGVDIVEKVVTKKPEVIATVSWFHDQLEKRGDLLDELELSHVDELPAGRKVDYLLLCIDEFSVLRSEKDTMGELADLAALGRALGIYVILSTQRPDSKVVDGLLKANLTVRYAFRHADKINSRITLGEGAKEDASKIGEEEKGKFYMRYSGCKYLQSPYMTVDEAKALLEPYKTRSRVELKEEPPESIEELDFNFTEEEA